MKKISAIIAAAAFTATLVSCAGEKTGTAPAKPDEPKTTAAATEETSENVTTKKATAITTTVKTTTTTQPDPLGGGSFEYNEDGSKARQLNYYPNGKLESVKVFEYVAR